MTQLFILEGKLNIYKENQLKKRVILIKLNYTKLEIAHNQLAFIDNQFEK